VAHQEDHKNFGLFLQQGQKFLIHFDPKQNKLKKLKIG
jgi:hypothetical protein